MIFWFLVWISLGWSVSLESEAGQRLDRPPVAVIASDDLQELSGIVCSAHPQKYWGINDSGNGTELFGFSDEGEILDKVPLPDAVNEDWEAITKDHTGHLYIGDFGDNKGVRKEYAIYQVQEPTFPQTSGPHIQKYRFRYAGNRAFNCESIFILHGKFYLITKGKKETDSPLLFCLDSLQKQKVSIARKVGTLSLTGRITDASFSPEFNHLIVLSKNNLHILLVQKEADLLNPPVRTYPIKLGKSEGVCFDRDSVVVTTEKGGIWKYSVHELIP